MRLSKEQEQKRQRRSFFEFKSNPGISTNALVKKLRDEGIGATPKSVEKDRQLFKKAQAKAGGGTKPLEGTEHKNGVHVQAQLPALSLEQPERREATKQDVETANLPATAMNALYTLKQLLQDRPDIKAVGVEHRAGEPPVIFIDQLVPQRFFL